MGGRLVRSAAPYQRRGGKDRPGVQVDLLILLKSAAYFVEVKHADRIDESIEKDLQDKMGRVSLAGAKSRRAVLVTAGEVDPRVIENGFFDAIITARELLGLDRLKGN